MSFKKIAVYAGCIVVLIWVLAQIGPVNAFIRMVKMQAYRDQGGMHEYDDAFLKLDLTPEQKRELLNRIQKQADANKIAPINAKLDRVWKAIPGYNGREVDVEKTFKLALDRGKTAAITFVYKEMPPKIGLNDLPPNPVYRGNPHKPMVSLMINVAWGDEYIPALLDALAQAKVHATFFLDGSWLAKHKETAQNIARQGHELSNHGYSHKNMSRLNASQAELEITRTEALLQELGGHNTLFAPPSGDYDAETVRIAAKHGLRTVLWTLDTVDWKNPAPEAVVRKIARGLEPGSLILMHPTAASSKALPEMIREIKNSGLVIGTVSDLLSSRRVPDVETPIDF